MISIIVFMACVAGSFVLSRILTAIMYLIDVSLFRSKNPEYDQNEAVEAIPVASAILYFDTFAFLSLLFIFLTFLWK